MLSVSAATAFANSLRGYCAVEGAFAGDLATTGGEGVGHGLLRCDGAGSFNQPGGAAPVVGLPGGAAPAVCEGDGVCVVAELGGAAPAGLLLRGGAADFSASGGAAPLVREGVGQPGGAAPADVEDALGKGALLAEKASGVAETATALGGAPTQAVGTLSDVGDLIRAFLRQYD